MTVSIVIPCFNYGRFLAEAVESALAQEHTDLEVIVVDDGSTDDSLEVARGFASRGVRALTHENQGLARTCNRGAEDATGELMLFLSADDRLAPTYVSELLAALEREPEATFAYCSAKLFGAESGVMRSRPFSAFSLVRGRNYINGSALIRRAEYLEAGGFPVDVGEGTFDDWDFWLTMLDRGKRGTYVAKPLLEWRRHESGSKDPTSRGWPRPRPRGSGSGTPSCADACPARARRSPTHSTAASAWPTDYAGLRGTSRCSDGASARPGAGSSA